jgi:hypothetical protein
MKYESHPMNTLSMRNHPWKKRLQAWSRLCRNNLLRIAALVLFLHGVAVPAARAGSPTCNPPSTQGDVQRRDPPPAPNGQKSSKKSTSAFAANDWNSPLVKQSAGVVVHAPDSTNVSALVNPAMVDESFRGFLQLTIAGLPTGAAVRVEKFQVNNSSGIIDNSAILEQSVLLTDGVSNQIGGIANSNVPADSTGADGTIAAQISFLDDSVPNTVAEYVFRFSSPSAAFAPMTAQFTVTDAPDAQKFAGTVMANGAPVPYAHVVLLNSGGGGYDFVAATVANASGQYSLGADPGEYDLVTVRPGFVGAFGKGVGQELTAGVDKSVDLTMVPGSRTISGQIRDQATSEGLPGLQVVFRSPQSGTFTVEYTDANGNFSTAVTPGDWDIEVERNAVDQLGYLAPSQPKSVDTSAGNVSNVAISLPKATALLYGTVTESDGAPFPQAEMDAASEDTEFQGFTVTDSNGNYVIAVNSGVWFVAPTASALQESGYVSPDPATPFLQNADAKQIDFAVAKANAHLSGTLRDEVGTPVPDTTFRVEETSGTGRFTTFATEEPDGAFNIGLTSGKWKLRPDFDDATDSDLVFIVPADFTLSPNQTIAGIDLRVQEPARHILVHVNDDGGDPYEGARVEIVLRSGGNTYLAYAATDENGDASVPAFDGTWQLFVQGPELKADGFRKMPTQEIVIDGSDPAVTLQLQLLPATGNTLVNLASRGLVQTGNNVLIGGFIITGNAPKKVLVRAIGPSLNYLGVSAALDDPTLTIFDSNSVQVGFNDNWPNDPNKQDVIDTGIAPSYDRESALVRTLAPGGYTVKVAGAGNTTGVALVEIYDLESQLSSRLANIATRGRVNGGDQVLIGGFIVGGYLPETLVIRAIGPSLGAFGITDALADPFLTLYDGQGTPITSNDNWETTQKQALIDTTLAPTNPKEAAILTNLQPGNYTAVVSGFGNGTGIGAVEVYNITPP